jgi:hypothetical protein
MGLLGKLGKGLMTVAGGGGALSALQEPSSLGKVHVGGKGTLDLPAGEVALWYQIARTEIFREDSDGDQIVAEPGDFVVEVRPAAGGDALDVDRGSGRAHSQQDLKHQRCKIGTVTIPAAGSYSIESSSNDAPGSAELLLDGS